MILKSLAGSTPWRGGCWMDDAGQGTAVNAAAIAGVDHSIVGVDDLEAARRSFENLGFTVTPRGRHIEWATANYCIMFGNEYVELLGIVDPTGYTAGLDTILAEQGEGILKLAFRSQDAERTRRYFDERGLAPDPVRELSRELELPEGTVLPEFSLLHPKAPALPGLSGFVCQHRTPELVWQPHWQAHRNTATGVRSYTILADDPSVLAEGWLRIFGARAVRRNGAGLYVETGTSRLDFLPFGQLPSAFEGLEFGNTRSGRILGMTVTVTDLVETAVCLAEAGASCMRTDQGMTVFPESACGVAISFVETR